MLQFSECLGWQHISRARLLLIFVVKLVIGLLVGFLFFLQYE
jgi:hypothetical protein